jgi:GTP-binding protein
VKVSSARFIKSAQKPADFPYDGLQEIAFIGRSNVGKSSLLNTLANLGQLARISRSPGRTQTINFYLINDSFYFVDLPGYGYAKVPKGVQARWKEMVEGYLRQRPQLKLALLLVDCRIPPTTRDILMKEWLNHYRIETAVVLTKADKLSRSRLIQSIRRAEEILENDQLIPFSAVSHLGRTELLKKIWAALS